MRKIREGCAGQAAALARPPSAAVSGMRHSSTIEGPLRSATPAACSSPEIADIAGVLPGGQLDEILAAAEARNVAVILMSGDPTQIEICSELGYPFLAKPFSLDALQQALQAATETRAGTPPLDVVLIMSEVFAIAASNDTGILCLERKLNTGQLSSP